MKVVGWIVGILVLVIALWWPERERDFTIAVLSGSDWVEGNGSGLHREIRIQVDRVDDIAVDG